MHAPRCEHCGLPLLAGQRRSHHLCDPNNGEIGHGCSCRPGCTDKHWGDAGTCNPTCIPCRTNAGRPYKETTP